MRRWVIAEHGDPNEVLRFEEAEIPQPGADEVLVEVDAVGLGWADLLVCRAEYQDRTPPPLTPGFEIAGRLPDGRRVMARGMLPHGGLADVAVAARHQVYELHEHIDPSVGACLVGSYHTAYQALVTRAAVRAGETVLVLGATGGAGSAAVDVAACLGAEVIAVVSSTEGGVHGRRLGATHAVDRSEGEVWDRIDDLLGGRGIDVVFDPVGGELAVGALARLAWSGRHLVVGFVAGRWAATRLNRLLLANGTLLGVNAGSYRDQRPDLASKAYGQLSQWFLDGGITPLIGRELGFEDVVKGLELVAEGSVQGKAVVRVG